MLPEQCINSLKTGLIQLGIEPHEDFIQKLLCYSDLLMKWNAVYNLTAIKKPEEIVTHHLLDSLAIAKECTGSHLADIGSGAGLPGLMLALLYPDKTITCIDASVKKTRFITQAIQALALDNIHAVHARVENYRPEPLFDGVICRAFALIKDFIALTEHLVAPGGYWLAMKARDPHTECLELDAKQFSNTIKPVTVPGLSATRHSVIIKKVV